MASPIDSSSPENGLDRPGPTNRNLARQEAKQVADRFAANVHLPDTRSEAISYPERPSAKNGGFQSKMRPR
jgi:hypothetical protein